MTSADIRVERLRRLPFEPRDTWQLDLRRVPHWVTLPGQPPMRPWVAFCVSSRSGLVATSSVSFDKDVDLALTAIDTLATDEKLAGYVPGRVEVRDETLATFLRERLKGLDMVVSMRDDVAQVDEVHRSMLEHQLGPGGASSMLESCSGDVDRVRSFAEAARLFYQAHPWWHLDEFDFIEVESDAPSPVLASLTVMGEAGEETGLAFFGDRRRWRDVLDEPPDAAAKLE